MFVLLRPQRNDREKFQRREGHFVDFHAILKYKPFESAQSVDPIRRLVSMSIFIGFLPVVQHSSLYPFELQAGSKSNTSVIDKNVKMSRNIIFYSGKKK